MFICETYSDSRINAFVHKLHLNGFDERLAWIHLCCFKFHFDVKLLLHMLHSNSRFFVCSTMCAFRLDFKYFLLQIIHSTAFSLNIPNLSGWDKRTWRDKLFLCIKRSRQYGQHFGFLSCVSRCHAIFASEWNTSPHEQMKSFSFGRIFK